MGKRGPRPTPNEILKQRGSNLLTKKREDTAPVSPPGPTDPPAYLTEAEADKWRAIVPVLSSMKCFTEADVDALVKYCQCWVIYLETKEQLDREGYTISSENREGRTITKKHPAFDVNTEMFKRLKDLEASFGLTPSARARIDVKKAPALPTAQKKKSGPLRVVPKTG